MHKRNTTNGKHHSGASSSGSLLSPLINAITSPLSALSPNSSGTSAARHQHHPHRSRSPGSGSQRGSSGPASHNAIGSNANLLRVPVVASPHMACYPPQYAQFAAFQQQQQIQMQQQAQYLVPGAQLTQFGMAPASGATATIPQFGIMGIPQQQMQLQMQPQALYTGSPQYSMVPHPTAMMTGFGGSPTGGPNPQFTITPSPTPAPPAATMFAPPQIGQMGPVQPFSGAPIGNLGRFTLTQPTPQITVTPPPADTNVSWSGSGTVGVGINGIGKQHNQHSQPQPPSYLATSEFDSDDSASSYDCSSDTMSPTGASPTNFDEQSPGTTPPNPEVQMTDHMPTKNVTPRQPPPYPSVTAPPNQSQPASYVNQQLLVQQLQFQLDQQEMQIQQMKQQLQQHKQDISAQFQQSPQPQQHFGHQCQNTQQQQFFQQQQQQQQQQLQHQHQHQQQQQQQQQQQLQHQQPQPQPQSQPQPAHPHLQQHQPLLQQNQQQAQQTTQSTDRQMEARHTAQEGAPLPTPYTHRTRLFQRLGMWRHYPPLYYTRIGSSNLLLSQSSNEENCSEKKLPSLFCEPITINIYTSFSSLFFQTPDTNSIRVYTTSFSAVAPSSTLPLSPTPLVYVVNKDLWFGKFQIHNAIWAESRGLVKVSWLPETNLFDSSLVKPLAGELIFASDMNSFQGVCYFPRLVSTTILTVWGVKQVHSAPEIYNYTLNRRMSGILAIVNQKIFFGNMQVVNPSWYVTPNGEKAVSWSSGPEHNSTMPSGADLIFSNDKTLRGTCSFDGNHTSLHVSGSLREPGDISIEEICEILQSMLSEPPLRQNVDSMFADMERSHKYYEFTTKINDSPGCPLFLVQQEIWFNQVQVNRITWQSVPQGTRVVWYPNDNFIDCILDGKVEKPLAADIIFSSDMNRFYGTCQMTSGGPVLSFTGSVTTENLVTPSNIAPRLHALLKTPLERKSFISNLLTISGAKEPSLEVVGLFCDEDHNVCFELPFKTINSNTYTLSIAPEQLKLPITGSPPRTHNIHAIIIAGFCTTGSFSNCISLRLVCSSGRKNPSVGGDGVLLDWDVDCSGSHTGFLPVVLYEPRIGTSPSQWAIKRLACSDNGIPWTDPRSQVKLSLAEILPLPQSLHKLLIIRIISISSSLKDNSALFVELCYGSNKSTTKFSMSKEGKSVFNTTLVVPYQKGAVLRFLVKLRSNSWNPTTPTTTTTSNSSGTGSDSNTPPPPQSQQQQQQPLPLQLQQQTQQPPMASSPPLSSSPSCMDFGEVCINPENPVYFDSGTGVTSTSPTTPTNSPRTPRTASPMSSLRSDTEDEEDEDSLLTPLIVEPETDYTIINKKISPAGEKVNTIVGVMRISAYMAYSKVKDKVL